MSAIKQFVLFLITVTVACIAQAEPPRLVVQVTVDQLRGDLLNRYRDHFIDKRGEQGFIRFYEKGTRYTNAHFRHANTVTGAGHATLATGALPSQHGIAANDWYDVVTHHEVSCAEDPATTLIGASGTGASPAMLTASTFSDELSMATGGQAKVYSVSIKDRGAVFTGGHLGKSFWLNKSSGNMVTSSYYYDAAPAFLSAFNDSGLKDKWVGEAWGLVLPPGEYHNDAVNQPFQSRPHGFEAGFPHRMPAQAGADYYGLLSYTPFGDQLLAAFAKQLVESTDMGADDVTDYLAISFSTNDYIGHNFGPYSLEAEDNLVRLDRTLADLFAFLDKRIGMKHVLVVISADHGVDAIPEYKKLKGMPAVREDLRPAIASVAASLAKLYGTDARLIEHVGGSGIYLSEDAIAKAGLDKAAVARETARLVSQIPGVALAMTGAELTGRDLSYDPIKLKLQHAFVPGRSGDVMIVLEPSTLVSPRPAASHGTPWNYDTYVPLYFTGWKVKTGAISRRVSPEDIAVTLSSVLGIDSPDRATGSVLGEIADLH
ncbi:MAG: alkaline phosphatase family protein [Pseudomonadales bacterium]|nr:alkaline phosphatase family protein [Pseudomonadales bacterium]